MTKNWKKFTAKKLNLNFQKLQFTYPCASRKDVQATEEAFSPQKKHPELQNMKFLNFFLLLRIIFALLDPDTDPNPESRYGSTDLIESGSETLPIGS
jgi:hypothetical protein